MARFRIQLEPMWGFAYEDFVRIARLAEDDEGLKQRSAELVAALGAKGEDVVERATRVGTAGTPYEVGDTLRRFQSLGFQDFMVMFPYGHDAEMLLRFSETVAPRLD